jgi:DNA-binding transcriptional LysR family regulator
MRHGSLSGAARALDSSAATVGRNLESLETTVGRALFTRSQVGLEPTPDALALLPHAEAMAAAALALERHASAGVGEARGPVRITASEIVGAEILPSLLTELNGYHPEIVIELALNNRTEDLLRRDADIAVRMVRPTQTALVARLVGSVDIGLYAHRSYLSRRGTPLTLSQMTQHALIGFDRDPFAAQLAARSGITLERDMFALRSDNDLAQLAAIRAGYGIGGCQRQIAERDSELVAVLPNAVRMRLEMWLVMHPGQRQVARVRAVYEYLANRLAEHLATSPRRRAMVE